MKMLRTLKRKAYHAQRYFMLYSASRLIPLVLVTEYPRSGGSWLCELLSSSMDMYFPRHSFQSFKPGIYHGHYLPSGHMRHLRKRFLMVRDGRDVMISTYYKNLFHQIDGEYTRDVLFYRKLFAFDDFDDIRRNLPEFLETMFTLKIPRSYRMTWQGSWTSFNEAWLQEHVDAILRYEELRNNTVGVVRGIIDYHFEGRATDERISESVERFSFKAKTGRDPGTENNRSQDRKGIIGDHKNHFTREAAEIFNHYAGHLLKRLGYEKDDSWIDRFS
ncbi:MAG: sulfotransferase domain-containing protein [bacterium]